MRITARLLCLVMLATCVSCGGRNASDQTKARVLANPYNPRVRGNVYHSKWKDFTLTFSTRNWRVESGPYALHLVAKDKFTQVMVGSRFRLFGGGSLEKQGEKLLRKLGMRDIEILAKEPASLQGLDALVLTVRGQFLVDYFRDLRVDRKVRLVVARRSRRLYWMAYVSTAANFDQHLAAAVELQKNLKILSRPGEATASRRSKHARVDVALGEVPAQRAR